MGQEVEEPMADDHQSQYSGGPSITTNGVIHNAKDDTPCDRHQKAMRPRIADEIKRRDSHEAGDDANLLNAEQHEYWPKDTDEFAGEDRDRDICTRCKPLSGE